MYLTCTNNLCLDFWFDWFCIFESFYIRSRLLFWKRTEKFHTWRCVKTDFVVFGRRTGFSLRVFWVRVITSSTGWPPLIDMHHLTSARIPTATVAGGSESLTVLLMWQNKVRNHDQSSEDCVLFHWFLFFDYFRNNDISTWSWKYIIAVETVVKSFRWPL